MSDQIHLAIGAEPWRPSPDIDLVEEYGHYDMPTSGVLSQSGCFFLFECVEGIALESNVWVYAPLLEREEEELSRLSGDELAKAMDEIWHNRDVSVALAVDDAILTGGVISAKFKHLSIRSAAFREISSLLDRERRITGALETASN